MRRIFTIIPTAFVVACSGEGTDPGGADAGTPDSGGRAPHTAADMVKGAPYDKIVFEIDSVAGHGPRMQALGDFEQQLETLRRDGYVLKSGGFELKTDQTLTPSSEADHAYTLAELTALAEQSRTHVPAANEALVHLVYVDGHYVEDTATARVLGFAQGHGRVVMFRRSIDAGCDSIAFPRIKETVCDLAEASVLVHEVGHILGLVNNGVPTVANHQDTANGAHCSNVDCIMYYTVDGSSFIALIADRVRGGNTDVSPFDQDCLDDLKSAQQ